VFAAHLPRGFVGVRGPDAESYLQRMVSNDVAALQPGETCQALLLTPKARVIAPLHVFRRAVDDYLLLTDPDLAATVERQLLRSRFAAKIEVAVERHDSYLAIEPDEPPPEAIAIDDYGVPAYEILGRRAPEDVPRLSEDELEVLRIQAGTPRMGREIDDRVLPAEAGLVDRAVNFTKGCYPGQEPIARLHYRGRARRGLRLLAFEGGELPEPDAEVRQGDRAVGRVTSAARSPGGGALALAYVRTEVPEDAELAVGERTATQLHLAATRP
jgi:folate-binding protein YgfZ